MPDLQPLTAGEAAAMVRAEHARGFLGLDPVTQNDALLTRTIVADGAQVFRYGDAIVGYRPNRDNPRQAVIATTSGDPDTVRGFTDFLLVRGRFTTFTSTVTDGQPAADALRGSGFTEVARQRGHVYRSGRYLDVAVWFATAATAATADPASGVTTKEATCAP